MCVCVLILPYAKPSSRSLQPLDHRRISFTRPSTCRVTTYTPLLRAIRKPGWHWRASCQDSYPSLGRSLTQFLFWNGSARAHSLVFLHRIWTNLMCFEVCVAVTEWTRLPVGISRPSWAWQAVSIGNFSHTLPSRSKNGLHESKRIQKDRQVA